MIIARASIVRRPVVPACAIVLVVLGLIGCGGSGVDGGGDNNGLRQATAIVDARYLIVGLETGSVEPRDQVEDLGTNPAYRTDMLVLRRVEAASTMLGSAAGDPWAQADEPQRRVGTGTFFIGVFELTRGQWQRLAGTTPWADVQPAFLTGATGDAMPACNLGLEAVRSACAGWRFPGRLVLPDGDQWEVACRAGSPGAFSWGEARDDLTVGSHAVVLTGSGAGSGPQAVGGRQANAFDLHDMHGNVWEWTGDGNLRGGSWRDVLPMARSANRLPADRSTAHVLAGARLIYVP